LLPVDFTIPPDGVCRFNPEMARYVARSALNRLAFGERTMPIWVTRAGKHGEAEAFALSNNVVVAGWDDVPDLSNLKERDELLPLLINVYSDEAENTLKNWETQLWAFVRRIKPGDIAILPRKRTSTVAFGLITGTYRYVDNAQQGGYHQLPVDWIKTDLPRQAIDGDLRYSIGGAMTVFQVSRNNAEARIRALLEGRVPPPSRRDEPQHEADETNSAQLDPEAIALNKIVDHVGRKFKGHELERLVEAVLSAQGFVTDRTEVGPDGGVDILCGKGPLGLEPPRVCVQVKSQNSAVDVKVVRELQGILNAFGADLGLLVSWGGFTSKADEEARRNFFKLRLWGPDELIAQIQSVYDALPEDIQRDLPLKRIWALVDG
jgi:restriction system protein